MTCRNCVVPYIDINLSGLEPEVYYNLHLSFVTSDKHRYYYDDVNMKWRRKPFVILTDHNQMTRHPDSPNSGKFWTSKPVSFRHVMLTTNPGMNDSDVREIFLAFTYYWL